MKCSKQLSSDKRSAWTTDSAGAYLNKTILGAPDAHRQMLRDFSGWLEQTQKLATESITMWLRLTRVFLMAITESGEVLSSTIRKLDGESVEVFFVEFCADAGRSSARSMQSALRNFLRFLWSRNWTRISLVRAVPRLKTYALSHIPRTIPDDVIAQLAASLSTERLARNRAILLILIGYGVRRSQVTALRLGDVDWQKRSILFRAQKGGLDVCHPLIPSIAEALAEYLRHERPPSDSNMIFLRSLRPYLPLSPGAASQIVGSRLKKIGFEGAPSGPHGLRHAFATRLLKANQPVKVIADLLGHRSLGAVAIYAKLDVTRLREVAIEWPEELS